MQFYFVLYTISIINLVQKKFFLNKNIIKLVNMQINPTKTQSPDTIVNL
jgi:hypothetical protein